MVSRKPDRVICVGWRIYSTICKLELQFPWKSNEVLDLSGFEDFENRGRWAQESEIKAISPLGNLKPLYDEEGGLFASFWTKVSGPLTQANVKFRECICCSIYTCFAFCVFEPSFFVIRYVTTHPIDGTTITALTEWICLRTSNWQDWSISMGGYDSTPATPTYLFATTSA